MGDRFVRNLSLGSFSRSLQKLDLSKNQFFDTVMLTAKLTTAHQSLRVVHLSETIPCRGEELLVPQHMRLIGFEGLVIPRLI